VSGKSFTSARKTAVLLVVMALVFAPFRQSWVFAFVPVFLFTAALILFITYGDPPSAP
jgi:hypothetical protein